MMFMKKYSASLLLTTFAVPPQYFVEHAVPCQTLLRSSVGPEYTPASPGRPRPVPWRDRNAGLGEDRHPQVLRTRARRRVVRRRDRDRHVPGTRDRGVGERVRDVEGHRRVRARGQRPVRLGVRVRRDARRDGVDGDGAGLRRRRPVVDVDRDGLGANRLAWTRRPPNDPGDAPAAPWPRARRCTRPSCRSGGTGPRPEPPRGRRRRCSRSWCWPRPTRCCRSAHRCGSWCSRPRPRAG